MKKFGFLLIALFLTVSNISTINAAVTRIDFRGTVDTIAARDGVDESRYIGDRIQIGTPFKGYYQFDSDGRDISLGVIPDQAVYHFEESPFEMSVDIGGFTLRSNPNERQLVITASNDSPPVVGFEGGDVYTVTSTKDELVDVEGLEPFQPEMSLELVGSDEVRNDVNLLLTLDDHSAYPTAAFTIQGIDPSDQESTFIIHGGNIRFNAVPEPRGFVAVLVPLFLAYALFRIRN